MESWAALFDNALVRFATSGTLITVYLVADRLGARRSRSAKATPRVTRSVGFVIALSVTGFYLLIGPTGGALWGGLGNLAGVALAGSSLVLRVGRLVRYPNLAGRGLLYLALPLATGVPWGLLVLSVPACVTSAWSCVSAERTHAAIEPCAPGYRLVPGIW
jgi:hypothetical protein